jgi:hypothetical protein
MAKLIDHLSVPSTKTELDLFSVPATQVAIENGYWHAARLINSNSDTGPWRFCIQADPHYLQLNKNYLYIKLKILKADGTDITATEVVGPINLLAKTLFKQVKIHINGKLTFDSSDLYAYRAFLETELNYNYDTKVSQLTAALYEKDTPAHQVENAANTGFTNRRAVFFSNQTNRVVELMAPIHADIMTDRLMLDNTEIHLELHRNPDSFALLCFDADPEQCKLQIQDMVWYVRKVELAKSVQVGLENTLQKNLAKYPIRRVLMRHLHIPEGTRSTPTNTLFTGQVPRRLVVGFVDSDAFYGNYAKSPFLFKNYSMTSAKITAAGVVYPREPLTMDFTGSEFVRPYVQLFESLGSSKEDTGNYISLNDFKHSHCLLVFDLSPDEQDGMHWQLLREGTTSIEIKFGAVIPAGGVEMICYAEFDNMVSINRNRDVYFDYTL